MLREQINYETDGVPNDNDLNEAITMTKLNSDIQIILHWYVNHSGWYSLRIKPTDTVESCRERMPKFYGV